MKDIKFLYNSIIAHRGIYDNKNIFENSIPAFKKSLEYNISIELDIHLLKDNTIVVFHDDNLKRMTGIDKEINTCTYEELNEIFFNHAKYKVPTLKEVLNLVNGKALLDIEIKNDYNYKKTCRELTNLLDTYKGTFIVKSFYPKYMNWFYKNRPNYIRGILLNDKIYTKYKNIIINFIKLYCKPDFYAVKNNIVEENKIQNIRKKNIPVLAWTIKSIKELEYTKKYVDGIIFDFKNYNIEPSNKSVTPIKELYEYTTNHSQQ